LRQSAPIVQGRTAQTLSAGELTSVGKFIERRVPTAFEAQRLRIFADQALNDRLQLLIDNRDNMIGGSDEWIAADQQVQGFIRANTSEQTAAPAVDEVTPTDEPDTDAGVLQKIRDALPDIKGGGTPLSRKFGSFREVVPAESTAAPGSDDRIITTKIIGGVKYNLVLDEDGKEVVEVAE
jgi:hypothetical protein